MFKLMFRASFLVAIAAGATFATPNEICGGIYRVRTVESDWTVNALVNASGDVVLAPMTLASVDASTTVEFHAGGPWLPMLPDVTVYGSAVRLRDGGAVFRMGGTCHGEWSEAGDD